MPDERVTDGRLVSAQWQDQIAALIVERFVPERVRVDLALG
jgi:hypothetical protein